MNIPLNLKFNITKGAEKKLIILRKTHDENLNHIILKFLAYIFFFDDNLQIEIDAPQHYKPDLVKFDEKLTWKVVKWIECGVVDLKKILKISKHNRQAEIYIFKSDPNSAQSLKDKVKKKMPRSSNIHYLIFDKKQFKFIKELMQLRNKIVLLSMTDNYLNFNFNDENLQLKYEKK